MENEENSKVPKSEKLSDYEKSLIRDMTYSSDIIPLAEKIFVEGIEISPYVKKKKFRSLLSIFKE